MIENSTKTIHGTLLSVYGIGMLIQGESGTGKSECALEMINRGHALVADDAIELKRIGPMLYGSAPETLKGLLEIRGLGICDVRKLYGDDAFANRCGIGVSIELAIEGDILSSEVFDDDQAEVEILGVTLEHFIISNPRERALPAIIEAAVRMTRGGGRSAEMELIASYNKSLTS